MLLMRELVSVGSEGKRELLVPSVPFCCESKTSPKIKVSFFKKSDIKVWSNIRLTNDSTFPRMIPFMPIVLE